MKLESLTPNLMVKNVNESITFYTTLLGFSLIQTVPENGDFEWGFVQKDSVFIMFQKEASIKEEYPELERQCTGGGLTFYIKVSNLSEFYEKIKNDVKIVHDLHKTPYGANVFAITDPDGFILVFSDILEG